MWIWNEATEYTKNTAILLSASIIPPFLLDSKEENGQKIPQGELANKNKVRGDRVSHLDCDRCLPRVAEI